MLDWSQPETWGFAGALITAIAAFTRAWVIPGVLHDRIVNQLKEQIASQEQEIEFLRSVVKVSTNLSDTAVDVLRKKVK